MAAVTIRRGMTPYSSDYMEGTPVKMRNVYICAAIFALLTAAKLAMPEHSAKLRETVLTVIEGDDDYAALVTAMGRSLYGGGFDAELTEAFGEGGLLFGGNKTGTDLELPAVNDGDEEDNSDNTEPFLPDTDITDKAASDEDETASVSETDSAGTEMQTETGALAFPENVRTDMPELPFEYCCPVAGVESSGFGFREHPIEGEIKFHYGTDLAANHGDEILAFADGKVHAAGTSDSYGNYIILSHEGNVKTLYAHMSSFEIAEGQEVKKGQLIGRVGQSGVTTGPHLHFELLLNDEYLNPEYYI